MILFFPLRLNSGTDRTLKLIKTEFDGLQIIQMKKYIVLWQCPFRIWCFWIRCGLLDHSTVFHILSVYFSGSCLHLFPLCIVQFYPALRNAVTNWFSDWILNPCGDFHYSHVGIFHYKWRNPWIPFNFTLMNIILNLQNYLLFFNALLTASLNLNLYIFS